MGFQVEWRKEKKSEAGAVQRRGNITTAQVEFWGFGLGGPEAQQHKQLAGQQRNSRNSLALSLDAFFTLSQSSQALHRCNFNRLRDPSLVDSREVNFKVKLKFLYKVQSVYLCSGCSFFHLTA